MPAPKSATEVQLGQTLSAMPASIMERYKKNQNWELYEKEWIFRNFAPSGKTWLDFGCGTGEISTQLALLGAARVISVDVTPGLVSMTQQQVQLDGVADRVRCICGDITTLPPEPVDFALAYAVLHHVPDRLEEIITAIAAWLKPGGIFIFREPICYLPILEWMRNHSGVQGDALDDGERKLTGRDLALIESHFMTAERVHFHTFCRLGRLVPSFDHQLRRVDAALRRIPAVWRFSGSVIGVCRKPG